MMMNNEISATTFCDHVRDCVGMKLSVKIIPDSARLISDLKKRKQLLC